MSQTASTAGAQRPCWGGIPLGRVATSEGETGGLQGRGQSKREGLRYPRVSSWPRIPQGDRLHVLRMHWMPHAERDMFVKKGKMDRKHMARAERQGLAPCYSPGLAELLGLQV